MNVSKSYTSFLFSLFWGNYLSKKKVNPNVKEVVNVSRKSYSICHLAEKFEKCWKLNKQRVWTNRKF